MANGTVAAVKQFRSPQEAMAYIQRIGARFRKIDPETGLQLFKNAANVVIRLNGSNAEILSNCVC